MTIETSEDVAAMFHPDDWGVSCVYTASGESALPSIYVLVDPEADIIDADTDAVTRTPTITFQSADLATPLHNASCVISGGTAAQNGTFIIDNVIEDDGQQITVTVTKQY